MSDRYYSFKCISYLRIGQLEEKLTHKDASHYCYILHDKDVTEEGELKESHIHLLITFKQQKSINSCRRIFEEEGANCLAQPIKDFKHDIRYLTHKDNPEKYQYNDEDVKWDSKEYWARQAKEEQINITNESFINDLCDKSISMKEMAIRYGRDYMKNYKAYNAFAEAMLKDEWFRGNIDVNEAKECPVVRDLMKAYNGETIERDDTVYSWEQWKRR